MNKLLAWSRPAHRQTQNKQPSLFLSSTSFQSIILTYKSQTRICSINYQITDMEKSVMVVGIDESEHSTYALEWTLQHFFSSPDNSPFKLVLVNARPSPSSVAGFAGPMVAAAEVMTYVANDLKIIAERALEKAKEICASKSISDVICEIVDGDPRNVLCEAVEKHHASVLVVGSHGYGAIKRAVLGSVSDYCAHHAHCSVMIVKKPKTKH